MPVRVAGECIRRSSLRIVALLPRFCLASAAVSSCSGHIETGTAMLYPDLSLDCYCIGMLREKKNASSKIQDLPAPLSQPAKQTKILWPYL